MSNAPALSTKEEKYDFILKMREAGKTYDEIASMMGNFGSGNAVRVFVARMKKSAQKRQKSVKRRGNRENKSIHVVTGLNRVEHKKVRNTQLSRVTRKKTSQNVKKSRKKNIADIYTYSHFIAAISQRPDIPYAEVILDRCEGPRKRDRALVKAVLSVLKHLNESG